jgi:hypothetical protein
VAATATAAVALAPLACDDDGGDDDPGTSIVEPGGTTVAPEQSPTGSPLQPQSNLSTPATSGVPGPTGDVTEDVVEGTNPESPDGDD